MKILNTFQFHGSKSLLWLITIFLLVIAAGCSKKDSAVDSLQKKKIAVSADSLSFYSSKGDLECPRALKITQIL
jgi:hypothetical protein